MNWGIIMVSYTGLVMANNNNGRHGIWNNRLQSLNTDNANGLNTINSHAE